MRDIWWWVSLKNFIEPGPTKDKAKGKEEGYKDVKDEKLKNIIIQSADIYRPHNVHSKTFIEAKIIKNEDEDTLKRLNN